MAILLVEDDPVLLNLLDRILAGEGYRVEPAASGPEALEVFRQRPGEFRLLITDMEMPAMNGGELARAIRASRPDLPVLFISGFCASAPRLARSAFLAKPFTPTELRASLDRLLQ